MRDIMATVFSDLTAWLNMAAGLPMRNTARVVPVGMGVVPGAVEIWVSEGMGWGKVTKWMKLLLHRGRVVMSEMGMLRSWVRSCMMKVRCSALMASASGTGDVMVLLG